MTDPRVDAYIEKPADFAQPILEEIRTRVHASSPDCVETMKWSTPAFDYKGAMCGMAAFKAHCMFGFWKAPLVLGGSNPGRRVTRRCRPACPPTSPVRWRSTRKARTAFTTFSPSHKREYAEWITEAKRDETR